MSLLGFVAVFALALLIFCGFDAPVMAALDVPAPIVYMSCAYVAVPVYVTFVVLVIISEGEALDGADVEFDVFGFDIIRRNPCGFD